MTDDMKPLSPDFFKGVDQGRLDAYENFRKSLIKRFGAILKQDDPQKLHIEMALSDLAEHIGRQLDHIERLESAIRTRDKVDEMSTRLLELASQENCTHGERKGMIRLVQAFIRRHIGQRNGADDPGDIPF